MCGVLLRNAAARHQWNIREGATERADVRVSPNHRAGKDLHQISSRFPTRQNFRGRQGSAHHGNIRIVGNKFDRGNIQHGIADELSPCFDAFNRGDCIENSAGADNHFWYASDDFANHVDGAGNGHGDFDDGDSALRDFLYSECPKDPLGRRR
jgi:hypothetical protein